MPRGLRGAATSPSCARSRAGCRARVVTVDVPGAGARERDRRNGFALPPRITARALAQGVVRPRWSVEFVRRPHYLSEIVRRSGAAGAMATVMNSQFDPAL